MRFSKNIPKLRFKKGLRPMKHDPAKVLGNEKLVTQAFWECLKENDTEGAMEIMNAHLHGIDFYNLET